MTTNQVLSLDFETILCSERERAHVAGESPSRDELYQRAAVEQHKRRSMLIKAAIGVQQRLAAQQSAPVVRASSTTSTTPIGSQPGDLPSTLRREVDALTEDGMDRSEAVASVRDDVAAFLDTLEDEEDEDDAPRKRTAKAKAPKATAKPKAKATKAANDADEEEDDDATEEEDEPKPTPKAKPTAKAAMRDLGDVAREIQARDSSIGWESAISQAYTLQLTEKANASAPRSIPTRREIRTRKGVAR